MSVHSSFIPLHDRLRQRLPQVRVTQWLIGINLLVFLAMLASGAGLWHSSNAVQLAWGANFGPATQDGEWWRLGSALFLHFGVLHLVMNMWALWDGGQLVERMYGHLRFAAIYFISGITGNLLSLVSHHGQAISGGASGAIFGVYGALLVCLWRERRHLQPREFRWLFWGASGFAALTIVLGLLIPGIDNAAHVGGFLTGLLSGVVLARALEAGQTLPWRPRSLAAAAFTLALLLLVSQIPEPAWRWSEEALARKEVSEFLRDDAAIRQAWQKILYDSKRGGVSFDELAGRIDTAIGDRYEESFEHLSLFPINPALPSAKTLEMLRDYAELRRDASRSLAEGLRSKDSAKIREAIALEKKSRELQNPASVPPEKPKP
ncbi:MAG: rhomboid family intramembrane serine protease [Propionivibrio sp.]|uniref:Rhomboid family intramembrane serine protease n=1 Tax=Candidatus Propionivibrio dominans TaxID=2954373 RepID=A0A9D7FIB3_9RHOO|nr:rhomboid family intramembrane serine protease [Candidatus Propionivibrio dominans]